MVKRKLENLDACIFKGMHIIHYTEYKPDCEKCTGYNKKCEEEGIYRTIRKEITNNSKTLKYVSF